MDRPRLRGIVHVVNSLDYGGLERVVADLAIEQHARGMAVSVFSICDTGGFRGTLESAGVPVSVAGKRRTLDLDVLRLLRRAAAGADVVHSHNFVPNYYAAAALLGWRSRPALVNTCHNMGTRLDNRRLRLLYRWSLRRTARVAMVGEQVRRRFVDDGIVPAARAATVLNGIPVARFAGGDEARARARARLGVAADAPLLGCVGRLVELKNHRLLLDCLPRLAARYPDVRVVLVGEGPAEAALREQAAALGVAGRVVFAGACDDVPALLPAMDVFVLPSLTEGLSIALLEACASGLAIVASDVGGNPEIVRDGGTGRLFASGDGEALYALLDELLGDAAGRTRLGAAAREWVLANASVGAMADGYERLYREALAA
ncbi:glycosyltransferase involved in cell wall biosynthesis [Luteimonas sp. J16]|jgi:glycosyltransferase involved in cell wall biosynthesis|uniref:glycosyltransferase n=1 Tax=unclassified Luteimonas TaxID=2629088 RepID=UPI00047E2687|nr:MULTISPECIES: glycosyltransferase [unclassified Luteimonas]TWG87992.1 glycosyltransferase involved in cell wall biosynthesis [Luteimonas sp. J16]